MGFTLAGWHASETSVCGQSQRPPVNGEIDEGTFFSAPGPPFRRAHRPEPNGSRSASAKESQPRSCDQLRPSPVRATAPSRQVPCVWANPGELPSMSFQGKSVAHGERGWNG
jgi:hypothetical protein